MTGHMGFRIDTYRNDDRLRSNASRRWNDMSIEFDGALHGSAPLVAWSPSRHRMIGWARVIACIVIVVTALLTAGCTFGGQNADELDTPRNSESVEEWDLREVPSAEDVGIEPGEVEVAYSSLEEPRPIVVRLPEGIDWQVDDITLVTFDAYPAGPFTQPDDEAPDPTGMDFRRVPTDLDSAYRQLVEDLEALGQPTDFADAWRRDVEDRPTSGAESGLRIESGTRVTVGYLTVGLSARFSPVDEKAILAYRIDWG